VRKFKFCVCPLVKWYPSFYFRSFERVVKVFMIYVTI